MSRDQRVGLYLIAEVLPGYRMNFDTFKIGISSSPEARLSSMQVANPRRLRLLMIDWYRNRDAAQGAERAVHRYIAHARLSGEWFSAKTGCPFEAMSIAGPEGAGERSVGGVCLYSTEEALEGCGDAQ